MKDQQTKKIADYIFKEVFGIDNPFSVEELRTKFASDIPLPHKIICSLSGVTTWVYPPTKKRIASQKAIAERFKTDEWLVKKEALKSIDDILKAWEKINFCTGEKYVNSKETYRSDSIYNSSLVYQSVSVFDSQNIIFSYKIFESNYLFASRDSSSCQLGIRMSEDVYCSYGFEISWSNKISKSMFIHDCFDLYECLFCSHIRSKKYYIANMQFEKEEYLELKKLVVDWVLKHYCPTPL